MTDHKRAFTSWFCVCAVDVIVMVLCCGFLFYFLYHSSCLCSLHFLVFRFSHLCDSLHLPDCFHLCIINHLTFVYLRLCLPIVSSWRVCGVSMPDFSVSFRCFWISSWIIGFIACTIWILFAFCLNCFPVLDTSLAIHCVSLLIFVVSRYTL